MKIIVTEIEASPEDLRSSSTLAGAFSGMLRRAFLLNTEKEEDVDNNEEE